MEQIKIENLSFSYPLCEKKAIDNISLKIESGEFILLCGKSGCGKTTLLKQLKKELAPHGKKAGNIFFNGKSIEEIPLRESAEKIGFVMQNPDLQIVTDKVWHELAFGIENLALNKDEIRLRTAEMASYFGIEEWFNNKTIELSGGQRQILNLASVMVMHPDVLVLDEPTSQLDPIAAENFLYTIGKINRELGTTIILTEQRLEEAFTYADRVFVMDRGKIISDLAPSETGKELNDMPEFLKIAAPTAIRIFNKIGGAGNCPVTVREGRNFLSKTNHKNICKKQEKIFSKTNAVELNDIYFRYDKNGKDILKNLSLKIPENSFFTILGGNGTGKTTLLKIISSTLLPYSGKIKIFGEKPKKSGAKIASMPQDVQTLFTAKTVMLDLKEVNKNEEKIKGTAELTKITDLLEKHPFDLSGGEQQRAALAKVLLCEPKILLLDEPTKGMDAEFKADFAKIIQSLKKKNCTVIMISHDLEFCAKYSDLCAMLFDGDISACASSDKFFSGNRFYTTASCRIARGIIDNAVTDEDIIKCVNE